MAVFTLFSHYIKPEHQYHPKAQQGADIDRELNIQVNMKTAVL